MTSASNTPEILAVLARHDVEFIVVGLTAAVLQGAPVVTFDLDIVYARTSQNIVKLLAALDELEAIFRNTPRRRIAPNESHLESTGHKLLHTKLGPLDVLGTIDNDAGYDELLAHSVELDVGGRSLRALGLPRLIEVKRRAGRPKDLAVLPVLTATLARTRGE
jgi:hypothetical protein